MSNLLYPIYKLPEEFMQDYEKRELPRYMKYWLYLKSKIKKSIIEEGSSFNLSGTFNKKFIKFEIEGKSEQAHYSGKNLLEIKNTTRTINGVTFTINADKSITMNGTATDRINFPLNSNTNYVLRDVPLKENTTYTLSYNISSSIQGVLLQIYYIKNEESVYSTGTFTTAEAIDSGIYIIVNSGVTLNNVTLQGQLEEGTTATPYEPYCGGIPAPNLRI